MNRNVVLGLVVAAVLAVVPLRGASDDTRVADAAMQRDRAAVRTLITQGADVNAAQGDGMTALHWAARRGDVEMVKMLLAAGANVHATTRLGDYTPLLMASELGQAGVIEALIEGGADVKKEATESGVSALMLASASGQVDAIKTLLSHGADVNAAESAHGETALMFAAAKQRNDAMRALLAGGAKFDAADKVENLSTQVSPEELAFLAAQSGRGAPPPSGGGAPSRGARGGTATEPPAAGGAADPAYGGYGAAPQAGVPGPQPGAGAGRFGGAGGGRGGRGGRGAGGVGGVSRQYTYAELVKAQGGMTPLLFAVRQGDATGAGILLDAGADVNKVSGGDHTSPLLMAIINGRYDLASTLIDRGADATLASDNGVTPLYAVLNVEWAPMALYPQPRAYLQQKTSYLDLMSKLIDKGADVNARLKMKVWYSEYNFPLSGVDEIGATPFWRAAYAGDVDAMKLLVSRGADPSIPTMKPAGRPRTGDAGGRETIEDVSGLPPVPVGGPGIPPLLAAAGAGFGEGYAGNSHHHSPAGWLPAIKYLVDDLHVDVNGRDHEGNTALHDAASRGDDEVIQFLVSRGADVKAINREGETTVDMANSPVQRVEPFPDTIALLEKLGAKNNHHCKACGQ